MWKFHLAANILGTNVLLLKTRSLYHPICFRRVNNNRSNTVFPFVCLDSKSYLKTPLVMEIFRGILETGLGGSVKHRAWVNGRYESPKPLNLGTKNNSGERYLCVVLI